MTNEYLNISIPVNINSLHTPKEARDICAKAIKVYEAEFEPLFERLIDMGDGMTTVMEDSLKVTSIKVSDNLDSGHIEIGFYSHFFSPCKDMQSIDNQSTEQEFEIENGELIFDIVLPPAWRPDQYDM